MYERCIVKPICKYGHVRTVETVDVYGRCKVCRTYQDNKRNIRYRKENPERARYRDLKYRYDVTAEECKTMMEEQHSCCAICGVEFSDQCRPNLDHCHKTGRKRGWLCHYCNVLLANAKDDITILNNAIKYIKDKQ